MTAIAIVVGFVALVFGLNYYLYQRSGRLVWKPLWTAFTLTAVALLYGGGGLMGYVVPRHNPFIGRAPEWVGQVVWPQVGWACVALVVSLPFWWHGIKRLSEE